MTRIKLLLFGLCCLFLPQYTIAQSIHYTPFYTTPAALNPAFTGMFDGKIRAGMIYRNQWASVTVPYVTLGLSADMPILTLKNGSYIAAGIQAMKDQAGDGNLSNFVAGLSVSYHRLLHSGWLSDHPLDIGMGIQAAYSQSIINLSPLYFSSGSSDPAPGIPQSVTFGIAYATRTCPVALGISASQHASGRFNYTVGIAAYNIAEAGDKLSSQQKEQLGMDRYYTITAGANWQTTKRLKISPALVVMEHDYGLDQIAGCEFGYRLSNDNLPQRRSTSIFLAGWYRVGETFASRAGRTFTSVVGFEHKSLKMGICYDYTMDHSSYSDGNGGAELFIRYIAPSMGLKAARRVAPYGGF